MLLDDLIYDIYHVFELFVLISVKIILSWGYIDVVENANPSQVLSRNLLQKG